MTSFQTQMAIGLRTSHSEGCACAMGLQLRSEVEHINSAHVLSHELEQYETHIQLTLKKIVE